jgi:hypothetical protein
VAESEKYKTRRNRDVMEIAALKNESSLSHDVQIAIMNYWTSFNGESLLYIRNLENVWNEWMNILRIENILNQKEGSQRKLTGIASRYWKD